MLGIVSLAFVQEGRPRIGFGQGGGFGGGFMGGGAMLLGMPEVQKELGVSDEQKGLIEDMLADLRDQFQPPANFNFQEFQNLSEEERKKRREEFGKRLEEIGKKSDEMVKMILDDKQVDRFAQIRVQSEGVWSFNRQEVAEKLGLSQDQRDTIRKIQEASAGSRMRFNPNATEEERAQAIAKFREQREKTNSEMLAVLTAQQRETWAKMQGKKFDFPQPAFGGGAAARRQETNKDAKK
jgi:hypothetical protein